MGLRNFLSGRASILTRVLAGLDTLERVQEIREAFRKGAERGEPVVLTFTVEEVRRIVNKL